MVVEGVGILLRVRDASKFLLCHSFSACESQTIAGIFFKIHAILKSGNPANLKVLFIYIMRIQIKRGEEFVVYEYCIYLY